MINRRNSYYLVDSTNLEIIDKYRLSTTADQKLRTSKKQYKNKLIVLTKERYDLLKREKEVKNEEN